MIRLRFLSPFHSNKSLLYKQLYRFSVDNKPPESNQPNTSTSTSTNTPPPSNDPFKSDIFSQTQSKPETETKVHQKTSFTYDPERFQQDTSKSFVNKLERMEQGRKIGGRRTIDSILFPVLLCLTSAFLYHCWLTMPYNSIYKHATINEYINRNSYFHAIFLGSLSFENMGHFVVYYPMMVYSLVLLTQFLKQRHIAVMFITNSLITTAATYYFEKYSKQHFAKFMTPKANGAVTPLCFMSCFLMMKPAHMMFKTRLLPYFILPFIYYMNEWNEYQLGTINEISRPAHFTAIGYGLICGTIFRVLIGRGKI